MNPKVSEFRKIDFEGDNLPAYFECAYCHIISNKGYLTPYRDGRGAYFFTCVNCANPKGGKSTLNQWGH